MAAARRKIRPEDIHGLKYFKALQGLIERLHFVGTQRDKAGNRDLHGGKTVPNTTGTQLVSCFSARWKTRLHCTWILGLRTMMPLSISPVNRTSASMITSPYACSV